MTNPGWTVLTADSDVVYVAMATGQVLALDAAEGGRVLWSYPANQGGSSGPGCSIARPAASQSQDSTLDAVYGLPVLTDDLLLITSYDRHLYAFERESGNRAWDSGDDAATEAVIGGVTVRDGIAYFGSSDHRVYAWDVQDKSPAWDSPFETANWVWGAPAVDESSVYVGSMDHKVYAIDRRDGTELWNHDVGASVPGTVTLADDMLFVGSVDKRLHALDARDGTQVWESEEYGSWVWGEALVHEGIVYFGSLDGQVHALAAADGAPHWEAPVAVDGAVRAGATLFSGDLVVGTEDGALYLLDPETGKVEERFDVDGGVLSTPVASGDELYVGTASGNIYSLYLTRQGKVQISWQYPPPK